MYEYINILSNLYKYVKRILCILSSNVIYEIKVYYYYYYKAFEKHLFIFNGRII